jgi:predicted ATP-grasp superfamily ATP-dependent carboligase
VCFLFFGGATAQGFVDISTAEGKVLLEATNAQFKQWIREEVKTFAREYVTSSRRASRASDDTTQGSDTAP